MKGLQALPYILASLLIAFLVTMMQSTKDFVSRRAPKAQQEEMHPEYRNLRLSSSRVLKISKRDYQLSGQELRRELRQQR